MSIHKLCQGLLGCLAHLGTPPKNSVEYLTVLMREALDESMSSLNKVTCVGPTV